MKKIVRKSALSGAMKDIDSEMSSLNRQKSSLKSSIVKTSTNISDNHKKESMLQRLIAKLTGRDAQLVHKKKDMESKSDKITDKIGKMSKIKSEMKDI